MRPYAFMSSKRNSWIHAACIACLVSALTLFGIAAIDGMPFPYIYQTTAIAVLTLGVYLAVRYALKMYRYEISDSGIISATGEIKYDLVITEITGAKRQVVARVGLWDVSCIQVLSRPKKKDFLKTVKEKYGRVFAYTNNPFDSMSCVLLLPEEDSVVIIPADDEMIRILKDIIQNSKYDEFFGMS